MKNIKKGMIISPYECSMMGLMVQAGFNKLHPGGKSSTEKLLEMIDIDSQKKVIDIGCGPGDAAIHIAKKYGCRVTGVDLMPEMIRQAEINAQTKGVGHLTEFKVVDAMSPPSFETSFDIAIIQAVLVFGDKQKMLGFVHSILRDNGRLCAIEFIWGDGIPDHIKQTFATNLAEPLINGETIEDWVSIFGNAGFRNTVCKDKQSMNLGTFMAMWLGEDFLSKIKIMFKCISNLGVMKKIATISQLFYKHPENLYYGFFLSEK
jgi:ubiquinone/menaquinone biosynthesis C-methylase UbiE